MSPLFLATGSNASATHFTRVTRASVLGCALAIGATAAGCASDPPPAAAPPPTSTSGATAPTSANGAGSTASANGAGATGSTIAAPTVPDALKPTSTDGVVAKTNAKGFQVYECKASTAGGAAFAWALTGPDAELSDDQGKAMGKHYAGPTWEAPDGSKVVGEKVQQADSPQATAVPWLLLRAKSTSGKGAFEHVTFVQRVDTTGGKAPASGCDAAHTGATTKVPYTATYYFYGQR